MAALARLPPLQGIAAMQSINVVASAPLFMTALFGTAAACVALAIIALSSWGEAGAPTCSAAPCCTIWRPGRDDGVQRAAEQCAGRRRSGGRRRRGPMGRLCRRLDRVEPCAGGGVASPRSRRSLWHSARADRAGRGARVRSRRCRLQGSLVHLDARAAISSTVARKLRITGDELAEIALVEREQLAISIAVTSAERRSPVSSPISPKKSPGRAGSCARQPDTSTARRR